MEESTPLSYALWKELKRHNDDALQQLHQVKNTRHLIKVDPSLSTIGKIVKAMEEENKVLKSIFKQVESDLLRAYQLDPSLIRTHSSLQKAPGTTSPIPGTHHPDRHPPDPGSYDPDLTDQASHFSTMDTAQADFKEQTTY